MAFTSILPAKLVLAIFIIAMLNPALGLYKNSYKYEQYEKKMKSHNEYKTCSEQSIEAREEHANVVFTGTIRGIYPDSQHPKMKKAQVEIKRVLKGENVIIKVPGQYLSNNNDFVPWHRRVITLEGLGDPKICHSDARKYDTRIFLANLNGNGNLKLNSSVVRLTMDNIIHAEAAVKDIPFIPTPTELPAPCERKYCAYGAQCVLDVNQKAYCKCIEKCSNIFTPVCGSDGVTYSSGCHLHVASCSNQRRIRVEFQRPCDVKDPCLEKKCSFGALCVPSLDGLTARCQCPGRCDNYGDSVDSVPICGDDGKDYNNRCEMEKASCMDMVERSVKYSGRCDPCEGKDCPDAQVCQLGKNRKPECKCNTLCPLDLAPVCGSDGRSYSNECILRAEACKMRKVIKVHFRGECSTGDNPCIRLSCGPGEECHVDRNGEARCICPPPCELVIRPVCGSDGITYDNECELRRQSCLAGRRVEVSTCKDGPCSLHKCLHGALCAVKNGSPECECPACSEEYQPVCGSDGIPYHNECKLKAENCENHRNVAVAHNGLCVSDGCENLKCEHYAICESDGKGMASCVCPTACVQVKDEVCGTNGVTYQNECEMRVASCEGQQHIAIASQGTCDRCANVKCPFGARCENGNCVCPEHCPDNNDPVCASDGETYTNECEMRRQSCSQGVELEMVYSRECDEEMSGSGTDSSGEGVCDEMSCKFGGRCDYDAEGPDNMCVCVFNCEAIRSPVCGSDGKSYGNECQMREESCREQMDITTQNMDNCDDVEEEMCDGSPALVNQLTGQEYDCGADRDTCPSGSYCHRQADGMARCCQEDQPIKSCHDTQYGCCPDGNTIAPGPLNSGCPSVCQCNALGSLGLKCDPVTRQCTCKPGVGGLRCDRCEPGYWGLPKIADGNSGCIRCGCNAFGSVRDDCEQMTGRCVCRPNITGQKCNLCPDGEVLRASGCTDASSVGKTCRDQVCLYGATCQMEGRTPQCVCQANCQSDDTPIMVCGSNGETYGSSCQLRLIACRRQITITVASAGPCQGGRSLTTTPRMTTRSRKTTRHINRHTDTDPTPSVPEYGLVGDLCLYDTECEIENSYCHQGVCTCKEGLTASTDRTECQAYGTTPRTMGSAIPSFSGNSYLQVKKYRHGNKMITIDIEFRTLSTEGILLYGAQKMDGKGDFVSLAIKDGYVEFRYDLGSGAAVIKSRDQVTLNKLHHVTAKRFGKDGMLKFDGGDTSGVSTGTLQSLNLGTPLFLGYVPNGSPELFKNIGVSKGFVGCIDSLVLDSEVKKVYDLTYPGKSMDIEEGFGITECGDNPCHSVPCHNGGRCSPMSDNDFHCDCPSGYSGRTCQQGPMVEDGCLSMPCQHGGTCTQLPDGGFFCSCIPGKHGDNCQHDLNGGITVPEFHGDSQLQVKLAKNVGREFNYEIWFLSTKLNGVIVYSEQEGTDRGDFLSLNLVNGYLQLRYNLGSGLANITSKEPISLYNWHQVVISRTNRAGDMAVDGGLPIRGHSGGDLKQLNLPLTLFLGGHPGGYNQESGVQSGLHGAIQRYYESGKLKENLVSEALLRRKLTQYVGPPCDNNRNPCRNGGTCMPHLNQYICKCPPKYAGKQCETVTNDLDPNHPVAFDGRTHHRYPNRVKTKQRSQNSNKIEIQFRTTANEGLMFLVHKSSSVEGDYLSIAVNYGRIEVSFNLGKEKNLLLMKSNMRVNDGKWHTLLFEREKRQASLTVDNGPAVTAVSNTGATQLDTDGNLWIGGSRTVPIGLPSTYNHGFEGCIQSVHIDEEPLNLVQDLSSHGTVQFCPL